MLRAVLQLMVEKPAVLVALLVIAGFVLYASRQAPQPEHYDPWAKGAPAASAGGLPDIESH